MSVCKIDELISNALVASLTKPKKGQISLKRSGRKNWKKQSCASNWKTEHLGS